MGLVEGIGCELHPVFPNLLQNLLWVAVLYTSIDEFVLKRVKKVDDLLSHRLTQRVGLASCEVS